MLNETFSVIFKHGLVRYGFLCRTKNDLWVWQKVSQLRVRRLIFHYVLTFAAFFSSLPPNGSKEVFFFKVWLGRLHVHKISQKIGKLIKYTLSNPLCIWCNAIVFCVCISYSLFSPIWEYRVCKQVWYIHNLSWIPCIQ